MQEQHTSTEADAGDALPQAHVSFSFTASKAQREVAVPKTREAEPQPRDFVTKMEGNRLQSVVPSKQDDGPLVIPLISTPPSALPAIAADKQQRYEEASLAEGKVQQVSVEDEAAARAILEEAKAQEDAPLLIKNRVIGLDQIEDEDERFRFDVRSRPDEADLSSYERVPVEEFGTALLRGMGWSPGAPIGLTNKRVVKPVEYVSRPHRLGLGATPKPSKNKSGKDGSTDAKKQRSFKEALLPGSIVLIASGSYDGMYARVVSLLDADKVCVQLVDKQEVRVSPEHLTLVDTAQLERGHPALSLTKHSIRSPTKRQASEQKQRTHKSSSSSSSSPSSSSSRNIWVSPNIVVRIVSKSFGEGKYYRQKAKVIDVISGDLCTVSLLSSGQLLEGIKQRMLETVLPAVEGPVIVVQGPHRGETGKLLERRLSQDRAVVQLDSDLAIHDYRLDDISYYVGEKERA
ncbi:Pre-mRNA-splicing factor SPP2 [Balamuthia mandrillaris]